MTTKARKYKGPRAFDGKFTRAMPEDGTVHSSLTLDEIKALPIVKWNETKQQWEFQE